MASERTCGECRDCRHWKQWDSDITSGDCTHRGSYALYPKEHFGCVLFEAKPVPKVADCFVLHGGPLDIPNAEIFIKNFAGNVSLTDPYTHVYHSAKHTFLFRYEKETNR